MSCSIGIRIIIWIYLLNITAVEVRGQVPLPNAVIRINGQTMLDCHTTANDLPLSYWRHSPNGNSLITISVGCNPSAGYDPAYYRTELIGGNICRLTIANVTMQQAGVYLCFDGANVIYRSLVTVIEPVASVVVNNRSEVVEGDQLSISCSISYNGPASPAPSLRPLPYWTTSPGQIYTNDIDRPSTNIVTLTATVTVQKPIVPVFQCGTVFETTGNTSGYNAIPPPDNFTLGSTTELDVQYTPSAPVISSRPEIIAIDGVSCGISVLTCSSMGNPVPNYRWFESEENVILSNTNILTLAEVKRTYICEAYNTIRNNMSSTSATTTVLTDNCTFTAGQLCCVFPRDEATSVTVEGCNNGTLCDCSNGTSGIRLICNATTFPTAFYMWSGPGITQPIDSAVCDTVTQNGVFLCTAYFNKALSNYTGDVPFSNGTNETNVGLCSNPVASTTPITVLASTTTPGNNTANQKDTGSGIDVGVIVGIIVGVIVIANIVATCLFFWYYKKVEVSHSGKIERNNKLRLDRRFTWLKKMMPCVSDTKESAGSNCLWVSLFLLLGIVTGIVTFPIWILLANKYEKNNETSALNKRENGEGNGSAENGRRPTNISLANHSQPTSTNQMNANRREDPYQNESSRENIELNNSLRSRTQLVSDSPPSRPPPAGRPPPPPNKPTMNLSTNRSKDYTVNDQQTQAANPEHTTYADLPFVPRNTLPTATPVQFLNVSNDTYASLNKT